MTSSRRSTTRNQQQLQQREQQHLISPFPLVEAAHDVPATNDKEGNTEVNKASDDESSDDNAVTRCPCGKEKLPYLYDNDPDNEDEGLMVQCDECEVWQHCKCVGLEEEKDIPDQYYCELCRPENHKAVKIAHGRRYKRYYSSIGFPQDSTEDQHRINNKPAKRRKTVTEIQSGRKSSRQPAFRKQRQTSSSSPSSSSLSSPTLPSANNNTNNVIPDIWSQKHTMPPFDSYATDINDMRTTRSKRSVYSPVAESVDLPIIASSSSSASPPPPLTRRKKNISSSPVLATVSPTCSSLSCSSSCSSSSCSLSSPSSSCPLSKKSSHVPPPSRNAQGRFHKTESRSSTPHPTIITTTRTATATIAASTTTTTAAATSMINHHASYSSFSSASSGSTTLREETPASSGYWNENGLPSREGSPPAKVKYPHPKMTMADMNKRAKQIMDHIHKMKSALQEQQQPNISTVTSNTKVLDRNNKTKDCTNGPPSDPTDVLYQHPSQYVSVQPINMYINSINSTSTTAKATASTIATTASSTSSISTATLLTSPPLLSVSPSTSPTCQSPSKPVQAEDELRPRSYSTCSVSSSISSASTLPLLLDDDDDDVDSFRSSLLMSAVSPTDSPLPLDKLLTDREQETSVDIMDRVYLELLKFQRKFGGAFQAHQQASSSVR